MCFINWGVERWGWASFILWKCSLTNRLYRFGCFVGVWSAWLTSNSSRAKHFPHRSTSVFTDFECRWILQPRRKIEERDRWTFLTRVDIEHNDRWIYVWCHRCVESRSRGDRDNIVQLDVSIVSTGRHVHVQTLRRSMTQLHDTFHARECLDSVLKATKLVRRTKRAMSSHQENHKLSSKVWWPMSTPIDEWCNVQLWQWVEHSTRQWPFQLAKREEE